MFLFVERVRFVTFVGVIGEREKEAARKWLFFCIDILGSFFVIEYRRSRAFKWVFLCQKLLWVNWKWKVIENAHFYDCLSGYLACSFRIWIGQKMGPKMLYFVIKTTDCKCFTRPKIVLFYIFRYFLCCIQPRFKSKIIPNCNLCGI